MPYAAKKPCRGCGRAIVGSFCEQCQAKGAAREQRPTAAQRGYDSRWQKARAGWLRSHPLCADPAGSHQNQVVLATDIDHIVPHKGDKALFWDSSNWQGLCKSCHSTKTAKEDGGFGRF